VGTGTHKATRKPQPQAAPPTPANGSGKPLPYRHAPARLGGNGGGTAVTAAKPKKILPEKLIPFEEDLRDF